MTRPTPARERVFAIDALRGFAVLGILLMNILAFALPNASRMFPDTIANNTGLNRAVWVGTELAVSGVFRTLFSILFGASALLFTTRKDDQLPSGQVADVYYRRTLWLIAFGLVHGFVLLGWIDVLWVYGLVGLFLFPFRRLPPGRLALLGAVAMAVPLSLGVYETIGRYQERAAGARADTAHAMGKAPSTEDSLLAARWASRVSDNVVTPEVLRAERQTHESGYSANFRFNAHRYVVEQAGFARIAFWDVAMMMLVGMALLKWGVLTAERSDRFYLGMALLGFGPGLAIRVVQLRTMFATSFDPFSVMDPTYHPSRLLVALGYVGLVMLVCRSERLRAILRPFSAVGRMALTNYVLQTVLCVLLFYGFGFGLFGKLERWQLLYVVAGIWGLALVVSPIWLRYFRFGPLEWLWRSLTYLSWQPMRVETGRP